MRSPLTDCSAKRHLKCSPSVATRKEAKIKPLMNGNLRTFLPSYIRNTVIIFIYTRHCALGQKYTGMEFWGRKELLFGTHLRVRQRSAAGMTSSAVYYGRWGTQPGCPPNDLLSWTHPPHLNGLII